MKNLSFPCFSCFISSFFSHFWCCSLKKNYHVAEFRNPFFCFLLFEVVPILMSNVMDLDLFTIMFG